MLLSKNHILEEIKQGNIIIKPFEKKYLGVDTIDLRLSENVLISKNIGETIDPKNPTNYWVKKKIGKTGIILTPGTFLLGSTKERIGLGKGIAAFIEGRSSIGRLGIMVHVTAGLAHAGFGFKKPSTITLEIYSVNPNPVKLYANMRIAQLAFMRLSEKVKKGYDELGRYINQQKPLPPKPVI